MSLPSASARIQRTKPGHSAGAAAAPARVTSRANLTIALTIFIIALAARLLFLFTSPDRDWPHSIYYEGDAIMWVDWATALDTNQAFEFGLPIHPPGVAYAIAWLYPGAHTSGFIGMKILWCAMSATACALTYLACAIACGRRVAVIASLLLCFSFDQYLLATSLNSETPYLMLLTAMVVLTQRLLSNPNRWLVASLGLLQGFAMLLRPEHPLVLLTWIAWMLMARESRAASPSEQPAAPRLRFRARLTSATLMSLVALLICLPWTIHATLAVKTFNASEVQPINFNLAPIEWDSSAQAAMSQLPAFARSGNFLAINHWAQLSHIETLNGSDVHKYFLGEFGWTPRALSRIVLVSDQGPFSFALANHPHSDGGFSRAALAHPMLGNDPAFAFAFPPHNQIFTDGWRLGWGYIKSDPRGWMKLVGRKLQRFGDGISGGFGAHNAPLGRQGVRQPVDMLVADGAMARPWQITLLALIAAGLILALARRIPIGPWLLIILYKLIITILFYGYARQAASIAPAFYILIAISLDSMLLLVDGRWRGWMKWQPGVAALLCMTVLISDVALSRHNERITIVGQITPRPDLAPAAFQSFGKIEIRRAP